METTKPVDALPPTRTHRRFARLLVVVGLLLFILVSRFATSNLVVHQSVVQRWCQDEICVERVHAPDLLLVPGRNEIHVGHDGDGEGRRYVARDPFDDYSDVKIVFAADGSISLSATPITLTWDAGIIERLDD